MKPILNLAALLPLVGLALAASPAQALPDPLSISLTPEGGPSVLAGDTLVFDAAFTNTIGADYLLDNATLTAQDPFTQGLLTPLFTGPFTIGSGVTTLPDVFELTTDPSLPPNTLISGALSFSGAPVNSGPDVEAASAPVQFSIAPAVPEAPPLALLTIGLLPVAAIGRRRRRA